MVDDQRQQAPAHPDWRVIGVYDDEAEGLPEFSYTVGLFTRDLPELFLWASPSDAIDPGDHWRLSHLDRGHLLNRWAGELIEGRLGPGKVWAESADFGLTELTFTCGEPVAPLEIEALMAHPAAQVLPIRFTTRRDAPRPVSEVDGEADATICGWTEQVVAAVPSSRTGPVPVPKPPFETSVGQRFGPATALVQAVRAAVARAEPNELTHLLMLSVTMEMRGLIHSDLVKGATEAFARVTGLQDQHRACIDAARRDAVRLGRQAAVRREFASWADEHPSTALGREEIDRLVRALSRALAAAYSVSVVIDTVRADVRTAGLAPVLTAVTGGAVPALWFPEPTRVRVRQELGDLSLRSIIALSTCWPGLQLHSSEVHVVALTGEGDSPPADVLLDGTPTFARISAASTRRPLGELRVMQCLTEIARAVALEGTPRDLPEAEAVRGILADLGGG